MKVERPLCADFVAKVILRHRTQILRAKGAMIEIITWGTAPSCAKLTGDSDNGSKAALIGDRRLFRSLAEN
jgi:hypothetical protein